MIPCLLFLIDVFDFRSQREALMQAIKKIVSAQLCASWLSHRLRPFNKPNNNKTDLVALSCIPRNEWLVLSPWNSMGLALMKYLMVKKIWSIDAFYWSIIVAQYYLLLGHDEDRWLCLRCEGLKWNNIKEYLLAKPFCKENFPFWWRGERF